MRHRLGAVLPAVAATLGMAALLGAIVAVFVAWDPPDGLDTDRLLRTWAIASGVALPLGFVFGVPLLAVLRSIRRGSRSEAGHDE